MEYESQLSIPINYTHFTCQIFNVPILFTLRLIFITLMTKFSQKAYCMNLKQAKKVAESTYYMCQYFCLYMYGRKIMTENGFGPYHFEVFFSDYPDRQEFILDYQKYFNCQLSVYIVSTIFLMIETRKSNSDFIVMCVHHMVTITLILTGYILRHYKYGICVGLCHDVTDIFLEGSKIINYLIGEPFSLISFLMFTISFFISRMIIFPTYLILPMILGVPDYYVLKKMGQDYDTQPFNSTKIWFQIVLNILYILDRIWMSTIFQMCKQIFRLEVRGDIRDSSEVQTGRHRKDNMQIQ